MGIMPYDASLFLYKITTCFSKKQLDFFYANGSITI